MADALTVSIAPEGDELELMPGETQTLLAEASNPDAALTWQRNGAAIAGQQSVEVSGDADGIGHYKVTATVRAADGATTTAVAAVHVKLLPEEKPALWVPGFAKWAGLAVAGFVLLFAAPAYVVAFRAAFGKDTAAQVVAMFLVLPGLLALGTGAYLLLLDYRGRMAKPAQLRAAAERALAADNGVGELLKGAAALVNTMGKATRGAAALVLAAVAIFGFAAWAAVGGNGDGGGGGPSDDPSSSSSESAGQEPSDAPTDGVSDDGPADQATGRR